MSFSFYQIKEEVKLGEVFWENSQYGCIQFEVQDDPKITDDEISFLAKDIDSGTLIEYFFTRQFMHYSPSISKQKEYLTLDEIKGIINE